MNAGTVLSMMNQAIEERPNLRLYTVIVLTERYLKEGDLHRAVRCVETDLDKLRSYDDTPKSKELYDFFMMASDCLRAARIIHAQNLETNVPRGSMTAKTIISYLDRFDLESAKAVYRNDGDKVYQYPKLKTAIESTVIGCRDHGICCCYHCNWMKEGDDLSPPWTHAHNSYLPPKGK